MRIPIGPLPLTVAALMALGAFGSPAVAQLRRLPDVAPEMEGIPAIPVQYGQTQPGSFDAFPLGTSPPAMPALQGLSDQPTYEQPPAHPPVGKDGFLQQVAFQGTYLPQFSQETGLGVTDLELSLTGGLPCPTRDSPMLITPYFAAHFMNWPGDVTSASGSLFDLVYGPGEVDLPATLYDAQVEFRWLKQWNEHWGSDLSATPGLHSDFQTTVDAFRLKLQAVAAYDWSPQAKLVLGIAYLDRIDVNWLPIAGVIWTPNDDERYELVFPKTKLARRLSWDGRVERWWYVAGELGGDQWAIEQKLVVFPLPDPGIPVHNVVTTRDYRVMVGYERKVVGGFTSRAELGYVFSRKIEFDNQFATPDFDPDSTLMVRVALAY